MRVQIKHLLHNLRPLMDRDCVIVFAHTLNRKSNILDYLSTITWSCGYLFQMLWLGHAHFSTLYPPPDAKVKPQCEKLRLLSVTVKMPWRSRSPPTSWIASSTSVHPLLKLRRGRRWRTSAWMKSRSGRGCVGHPCPARRSSMLCPAFTAWTTSPRSPLVMDSSLRFSRWADWTYLY